MTRGAMRTEASRTKTLGRLSYTITIILLLLFSCLVLGDLLPWSPCLLLYTALTAVLVVGRLISFYLKPILQ